MVTLVTNMRPKHTPKTGPRRTTKIATLLALGSLLATGVAQAPGLLPYSFTVVIEQTQAGGVPHASQLPQGCKYFAGTNYGYAVCVPPVDSPARLGWFCSFSGTIAQASQGTVRGTTFCANEAPAEATATAPGVSWALVRDPNWALNPRYDFPFYCVATFGRNAVGSVLCDEPDPPVLTPELSPIAAAQ